MKILFVCLGNICRSPSAEGVMRKLLTTSGLSQKIEVDSAGTIAIHSGQKADPRMRKASEKRGIVLTSISRKLTESDYNYFDYIIAMDNSNFNEILSMAPSKYSAKILRVIDFSNVYNYDGVPDPYYGGDRGFEEVLDILEECLGNLLLYLKTKL